MLHTFMKQIKVSLLAIAAVIMVFAATLCVTAVNYDNGTEVVAHIDSSTEPQPTTVSCKDYIPQDNNNVKTGKEITILSVITIVCLFSSFIIIYVCSKHNKNK